jgi:hypothetical protein
VGRDVRLMDHRVQVSGNKVLLFVELFTVNSLLFLDKKNISTPKPLL